MDVCRSHTLVHAAPRAGKEALWVVMRAGLQGGVCATLFAVRLHFYGDATSSSHLTLVWLRLSGCLMPCLLAMLALDVDVFAAFAAVIACR
jgi:hypothetical protein